MTDATPETPDSSLVRSMDPLPATPSAEDLIPELQDAISQLRRELEERSRSSMSIWELDAHIQRTIERSLQTAAERPNDEQPKVHVDVTVARRRRPIAVVLSRLRMGLYGLCALGFTSVVGGAILGELTNTTILLGLLSAIVSGLVGVVLELVEKFS